MGKKRRILTRTTKFAKKYFEFLDTVDATTNTPESGGQESDDVLEGSTLYRHDSIADNENQTITVTGVVIGNVGGDQHHDKVQVSVDGGAFQDSTQISSAGSGTGKFTHTLHDDRSFKKNTLRVVVRQRDPQRQTSKRVPR